MCFPTIASVMQSEEVSIQIFIVFYKSRPQSPCRLGDLLLWLRYKAKGILHFERGNNSTFLSLSLSLVPSLAKLIYITGCPRSKFYFNRRKTKVFKSVTSPRNWNSSSTFVEGTLLPEMYSRLHLLVQGKNVRRQN